MSKPPIAIFGKKEDSQVITAHDAVAEEGGNPLLFSIQNTPHVSLGEKYLQWEGKDFSDIEAVYIRGTAYNTPPALPAILNETFWSEWRAKFTKEQGYQSCSYSFFSYLAQRDKLVINPLTAYVDHNSKSQFYEKLRAWGFNIPKTITTNSSKMAEAFMEEVHKAVIKPGIGVGSTRLIEKNCDKLEDLALCPVTFQEFVSGYTVRVHIVGDTVVLALKILGEGVDSRTGPKKFEYIKLPEEEEKKIVRANRMLGLHFSAWDIIAAGDGRYFYLDCNPGPYIMWIGREFARVVFKQLAKYMISYSLTHSIKEASSLIRPWKPRGG